MRLVPSAVFRHALRVFSVTQLSRSFHDGIAASETPEPAKSAPSQPPKMKLTVKHRGVDTNPDEPSLNITAYADLLSFNDPKRSAFPIPEGLPGALQNVGYVTPTPIQQHTIPMMLLGEDLIGLAPTGTGKTLAFAVPAFTRIDPNVHSCQVLVLCPTRELAMQTFTVFEKISQRLGIRCANAYGGAQNRSFQSRQCAGAQIVVATPGRLTDFAREGIINLGSCGFFVLDEADRLLDMGFKPQIDDIMYFFRTNKLVPQTLMWSATWDDKIQSLAAEYIKENHFLVSTGAHETGHSVNPLIEQLVYFTDRDRPPKLEVLMKLYQDNVISTAEKAIIFVERKGTAAAVFSQLQHRIRAAFPASSNMFCMAVHGDLAQRDRERAIHTFKNGPCNLLVATDVVARGIDIPNVAHVINYEMPSQFDSYVHRIGRTGRNGKHGYSHAFFETANDIALAPSLEKFLRASAQKVPGKLSQYVSQGNQILQRRQERKDFARGGRGRGGGGRGYSSGHSYQRGGGRGGGGGGGYRDY
ncbi:ATP dependent RNA helicase Hel61p [Perkinsela sp. CCAP 1560/4]|nr:ATP dependent RNA helicase Hel61p [Perkinsela sp. CCAP 1560/4]|eukprot:KNH04012.1 ATP dependent RNA helicase Hel61p [Perkinsela sp. CCAP 1560/4]